jgi:hypothetical protein
LGAVGRIIRTPPPSASVSAGPAQLSFTF